MGLDTLSPDAKEVRGERLEVIQLDARKQLSFFERFGHLGELRLDCGLIGDSSSEEIHSLKTYANLMNDLRFPLGQFCNERYGTARTQRENVEGKKHLLYILNLRVLRGRDFERLLNETGAYLEANEIPII